MVTRKRFLFYVAPEFTMLAFTAALEALRLANQVLGEDAYEWKMVSSDGEPVRASCGLISTILRSSHMVVKKRT